MGKKAINGLLGVIESGLNWIIDKINAFIGGLSSVVGFVGDLFGADWNIPKIPNVKIPRLAQGAVLPANKPFLAQLGDQKNGRNLEAPESLLREIYSEQNQPMIAILSEMLEELKKGHVIKADKREIAKTVREGEKDLGKSFVTGGFANAY